MTFPVECWCSSSSGSLGAQGRTIIRRNPDNDEAAKAQKPLISPYGPKNTPKPHSPLCSDSLKQVGRAGVPCAGRGPSLGTRGGASWGVDAPEVLFVLLLRFGA